MIPTFHPQVSVLLTKVVKRGGAARVQKVPDDIDLTLLLGDSGSVVTSRSLSGAGGSFTVTLTDQMDPFTQDTVYTMIEPMDHVTIRMAREPHRYSKPPVVMRGFVTSIKRTEIMGHDGKPVRAVVITGHDYHKLLFNYQIYFRTNYTLGEYLLTAFPMLEAYGLGIEMMDASTFVETVVKEVLNPFLVDMWLHSALGAELTLNVDARVKSGRIGPYGIQFQQGTLWNLIAEWADLAWNELFFEDREEGTYLVYRPRPYQGLDGKLTSQDPGAALPDEIEIGIDAVRELSVERSDLDVANYFAVQATQSLMFNREQLEPFYLQNGARLLDSGLYPNSYLPIYGLKKLEAASGQYDDGIIRKPDTKTPVDKKVDSELQALWIQRRWSELQAANRDNVVLEHGSIKLRGNEQVKPGINLILNRGATQARYYVNSVTHEFKPFVSYETTVQVSRGTGFVERLNQTGSPYQAEGRSGVYE